MTTATIIKYVVVPYIVVSTFHIVSLPSNLPSRCYFLFYFVNEVIGLREVT